MSILRSAAGVGLMVTLAVAGASAAAPSRAEAQQQNPQTQPTWLIRPVRPGDTVVILGIDDVQTSGRVIDLTPSSLRVETKDGRQLDFAQDRVTRILKRDPVWNGMNIGMLVGGAAGTLGGIIGYAICVNEGDDCAAGLIGLIALGIGGGAGIGAGLDSMNNAVVYRRPAVAGPVPETQLRGEFKPEVLISMVGGSLADYDASLALPPSVAGTFVFRSETGFGAEAEVSKSFGESREEVPCVSKSGPGHAVDPCAGSSERSIEDVFLLSGSVLYFFPRVATRLQPYGRAGGAWGQWTAHKPYFDAFSNSIETYKRRNNQGFVLLGGGVRVGLTRRFSLDAGFSAAVWPDVHMFRINGGFGYGW